MNTTITRTIATVGAASALVVGGAAAAQAGGSHDDLGGDHRERGPVAQLVHDAVEDGTVTGEEEDAIKQAIEKYSDVEIESLDDAAPQG